MFALLAACASAPPPLAEPAPEHQKEALVAGAMAAQVEAEARARQIDDLMATYDAANLVEMSWAERATIQAGAMAKIAKIRFQAGHIELAVEAIEKAINVAKAGGTAELVESLSKDRFLIRRYAALEVARSGRVDEAEKIFDRLAVLPGLTRAQRKQIAGDRLLILEMRDGSAERARNSAFKAALARILGEDRPREDSTPDAMRRSIGESIGLELPDVALPSVGQGPAAETGKLSASIVVNVVAQNKRAVSVCYDRSLKSGDTMDGRLEVSATVEPSGTVSHARVAKGQFSETPLATCIVENVRRWRFPPFAGAPAQIVVPFMLSRGR